MLSWPPATTMLSSPSVMCWAPSATALRPEPQTWLIPQAALSFGSPALMCACRAGFCPCAAVSTWPRMVSETSSGATPARSSTARITAAPRSCAGVLANAPLKLPTAVRAADAITILLISSSTGGGSLCRLPVCRSRARYKWTIRPPAPQPAPSSHMRRGCSTEDALPATLTRHARRETRPAAARPRRARRCPRSSPRGRCGPSPPPPAAGRAPRGSARGGGAMLSLAPQKRSAGTVTLAGSTVCPRKRQTPRRRRVLDLPAEQQVLGGADRHRHAVGQPVLQRHEEPRRRAVGIEPRQLLELERRLHRVDEREEELEERDRDHAEGLPLGVEQRRGALHPLGADAGAEAAGEPVRGARSPRARRWWRAPPPLPGIPAASPTARMPPMQ